MKVSTHTARLTTRLARARDIYDLLAPAVVCRIPYPSVVKGTEEYVPGGLRACVPSLMSRPCERA